MVLLVKAFGSHAEVLALQVVDALLQDQVLVAQVDQLLVDVVHGLPLIRGVSAELAVLSVGVEHFLADGSGDHVFQLVGVVPQNGFDQLQPFAQLGVFYLEQIVFAVFVRDVARLAFALVAEFCVRAQELGDCADRVDQALLLRGLLRLLAPDGPLGRGLDTESHGLVLLAVEAGQVLDVQGGLLQLSLQVLYLPLVLGQLQKARVDVFGGHIRDLAGLARVDETRDVFLEKAV